MIVYRCLGSFEFYQGQGPSFWDFFKDAVEVFSAFLKHPQCNTHLPEPLKTSSADFEGMTFSMTHTCYTVPLCCSPNASKESCLTSEGPHLEGLRKLPSCVRQGFWPLPSTFPSSLCHPQPPRPPTTTPHPKPLTRISMLSVHAQTRQANTKGFTVGLKVYTCRFIDLWSACMNYRNN